MFFKSSHIYVGVCSSLLGTLLKLVAMVYRGLGLRGGPTKILDGIVVDAGRGP